MEVKRGAWNFARGKESNVWSTAQGYKRSEYMMLMLGLKETIDQLVMVEGVCVGMIMC